MGAREFTAPIFDNCLTKLAHVLICQLDNLIMGALEFTSPIYW
jgi:hypothetical protein